MPTIFDLELELQQLRNLIESSENTAETDTALADWITAAEGDLNKKIEGYCSVIGELQALADAREVEGKRLMALAATDSNNVSRLKAVLKGVFQRLGLTKVETTRYKVRLQTAGGKQRVEVDPFARIPDEYMVTKTTTELDMDKVRSVLDAGELLEFATMLPRGNFIVIK